MISTIQTMEYYDENLLVKEGLAVLFQRFGFSSDAYTAKSFAVYVGKIPIRLPNIPSRVWVARFHDIHHVLTGYPANWRGEAEIGAWELATGCRTYWVAWFFNLGAVFVGLFLFPRAVVWAFIRGRNSRTNLYHEFEYEPLLDMRIKALRERIGLV